LGDCLVALIVLWISACSISTGLAAWFRRKERKVRKTRWLRLIFGICLAMFCIVYIGVSIRVQWIQLREQSKTQSLVYQNQMILREHVQNFATDVVNFSKNFDPNNWAQQSELFKIYLPEINSLTSQMRDEGIRSTNISNLFDEHGNSIPPNNTATNLMKIAAEFETMALQLPKK
jgi:hypothetical protein